MKKYAISILAALALGVLSFGAIADPIGPTCDNGNDTCQGSLYAITYSGTALPDSDPLNETFEYSWTSTPPATTAAAVFCDNGSIKVASSVVSCVALCGSEWYRRLDHA